ncbi:GPW/gp25 family protein [bacterium]|nr:GPW/gp25 family protein [bacterium]
MNDEKTFLGKGLSFPLHTDAKGEVAMVTGAEDIEQSIRIILGTMPGERVMRPTFGCRAHELLFEPRNATTFGLLQDYVEEALKMWEPRIQVNQIIISNEESPSALLAEIEYEIKATHDPRSIIYPFYIEEEAGAL